MKRPRRKYSGAQGSLRSAVSESGKRKEECNMKIYDLRTEYRKSPFGLSVRQPRFSWKIRSDEKNVMQTICRIRVMDGENCVWDTGMRESSDSVLIPYEGMPLKDETLYR